MPGWPWPLAASVLKNFEWFAQNDRLHDSRWQKMCFQPDLLGNSFGNGRKLSIHLASAFCWQVTLFSEKWWLVERKIILRGKLARAAGTFTLFFPSQNSGLSFAEVTKFRKGSFRFYSYLIPFRLIKFWVQTTSWVSLSSNNLKKLRLWSERFLICNHSCSIHAFVFMPRSE